MPRVSWPGYQILVPHISPGPVPFMHLAQKVLKGVWKLCTNIIFFLIFIYLIFILAAPGLSCGMWDLLVAAGSLLSCSMSTLSCGMHVGSSSLTRDRTWAPCTGSMESYPLDYQGSPWTSFFKRNISNIILKD